MADDRKNSSPDENGKAEKAPEGRLLGWFLALVGLSAMSLLWLACRASSPAYLRTALDFCMQAALGCLAAYFAFRTLYLYTFHLLDLLLMVVVLSFGVKTVIELAPALATVGIVSERIKDPDHWGELLQFCLVAASVLLLGAAFGLRSCLVRKIENTFPRLINILAGMLALPAAAGVAVFPVWLLRSVAPLLEDKPINAWLFLLYWASSIIITGINCVNFIKNLTLTDEIKAQEKMP